MLAGRPHEAASNGSPRWMAAGPRERVHRTRPTGQLARRLNREDVAASGHAGVVGDGALGRGAACFASRGGGGPGSWQGHLGGGISLSEPALPGRRR